ncbi:hypothetical protein LK994_09470 [Ferruginibacter lapsinanis]|uniref:hypothetical protein n=1 Tax=Ferruginibacter lapsinanis TaxID=563172 RepID=UPI001E47F2F8|nr:hypothetical protein [Ferruginibacter lapsinanis]UEG48865.1 hypothetical protein LK994_09470 [Ferruginibacter lapsinanis]
MAKKKSKKTIEDLPKGKYEEVNPDEIRDDQFIQEPDPDIIPDEDPYETPPYVAPEPGEGP